MFVCLSYHPSAGTSGMSTDRKAVTSSGQLKKMQQDFIPFEVTPEGHIIFNAKIDNVEGRFILDTGAGINVITKKFADKLNDVRKQEGKFTGFRATGEALHMSLYTVGSIRIGRLIVNNPILTILNADLVNTDGLISLTCFRKQPFTIDFVNKKIYLENKESLTERMLKGKSVPIQLDDDRGISLDMFTRVKVNDKLTLQISLDSGAGFNVFRFNSEFMGELGIDTVSAKKYTKPSSMNPKLINTFYSASLNKISMPLSSSVKAKNVKTFFLPGLIYDGITCINWLGKKITVDITDKKLILN